ncbi:MAG: translation initiation factor eIF-2B [Promethearchaeota archaeon]
MKFQNIQNQLDELRSDNASGASEFINKALEIIKKYLRRIKDPNKIIKEDFIITLKQIIDTRPSMAPLINTMAYLINNLNQINKNTIETRLKQIYIEKEKRFKSLEVIFQRFLEAEKSKLRKIMTLSYSSTIINLLLKSKKLNFEIYVMESRPLLEGHRVAELLSSHFQTHLIIDAAIGAYIDEIDVVLIGVDSILKDGSIINKIGTFPLALLAKSKEKDVYAVCDTYKYNLKSHYGYDISIKEKPISEVYNKQITNKFLEVHNYYFDITPPEYLSGIISELGVLKIPEFLEQVTNVLPVEWFKYFINNKKI